MTKRCLQYDEIVSRRKLPTFPTLVYAPTYFCEFTGPFQFYFQDNAFGLMFAAITSDENIRCRRITDFVFDTSDDAEALSWSKMGVPIISKRTHYCIKSTNDFDEVVELAHLSNYISITKEKIDKNQRILLDVTEVLHQVDVAVRTNLNIPVITDVILSYFNIWIGIPMQKQSSSVISKIPFPLQWWFVKDDEEVKSNKDILLGWFEKDTKLYQLVKKITEFDTFIDDHDDLSEDLETILIVQKQYFDLSKGRWVGQQRKHNEHNCTHDNSWCSGGARCKNSFFIDSISLHLSTWATGCQLSGEEQTKLFDTCQLIQEMGDDLPQMKREYNLLFTLDELRTLLIK
jgi:hypothetical protein